MGFVAFVEVGFKCFDLLAWPLFALGYPLCASIQAIETNSNCQARKLVTYWILFSLISLFEHTFVKLLEWVPFWPYIKLVIICCLVIPCFDGAFCIYNHLVHPCLSLEQPIFINWFNKQKDFIFKRDDLLAEAESYVKENGPEALETLIANKSMCQEPSVVQEDIKTVEVTEKKEVTAVNHVNQPEPNLAHIENRTFAPVEIEEPTAAVEEGWEHTLIPAFKKVQNEWTCTCGGCQVTTQSKTTLNSHLRGRRHQAACEELEAKNQASKSKVRPVSVSKKSDLPTEEKCASPHKITSQEGKRSDPPKEVLEKCASSDGLNGKVNARPEVKKSDVLKDKQEKKVQGQQDLKNQLVKFKWKCKVCNIKCYSEGAMYSHLNGKKHLSQCSG